LKNRIFTIVASGSGLTVHDQDMKWN
jgi:hypothetical protein